MNTETLHGLITLVFLTLLLTAGCGKIIIDSYHNEHIKEITVKRLERVTKNNSSTYMVFTESGDSYRVEDSFMRFIFDASDRYALMDEGGTYKCKIVGARWRFITNYPNLLEVEVVK